MSSVTGNAKKRQRPRATRPPGNAQPKQERHATGDEPDIAPPPAPEPPQYDGISGVQVSQPANPYAPTGWTAVSRKEFDIRLPNETDAAGNVTRPGQLARITRLERDDLFRLGLQEYLDTFTPLLMAENADLSEAERGKLIEDKVANDPAALTKLLAAVDQVVMSVTVKPRITEDPELVDFGSPVDWANPAFVATVPLEAIPLKDRMFIFGAAFGQSMDHLKSVWDQAEGMGTLANVPGAAPNPQ